MGCFSNNGCCDWIIILILICVLCGGNDRSGCGCNNC